MNISNQGRVSMNISNLLVMILIAIAAAIYGSLAIYTLVP